MLTWIILKINSLLLHFLSHYIFPSVYIKAEVLALSDARKNANVKQWKFEIDANFHREMQLGTRVFD